MWFIDDKKEEDHTQIITISDVNFKESLERITKELKHWMTRDVQASQTSNVDPDNTLAFQLANINIKSLPRLQEELEGALTDNDFSLSASRFFDCINYLYLTEPEEVFTLLTDRFLNFQLNILPKKMYLSDGEHIDSPDSSEWIYFLEIYPWIPLLCIIQHEYDIMLEQLQD